MDQVDIAVPYTSKINLPSELMNSMPAEEADALQEILMDIYYTDNPAILKTLTQVSEDEPDRLELKKEQQFNEFMNEEYAFDIEILSYRQNDAIADILVDKINSYNSQVELIS